MATSAEIKADEVTASAELEAALRPGGPPPLPKCPPALPANVDLRPPAVPASTAGYGGLAEVASKGIGLAGDAVGLPLAGAAGSPLAASGPEGSSDSADAGVASSWRVFGHQLQSYLASTVFHLLFMIALVTLTVVQAQKHDELPQDPMLASRAESAPGNFEELSSHALDVDAGPSLEDNNVLAPLAMTDMAPQSLNAGVGPIVPESFMPGGLMPAGSGQGPAVDDAEFLKGLGDSISGSLKNRTNAGTRARLVRIGGGTPASEEAVSLGLQWLSKHQSSDGSWSFDLQAATKCRGRCANSGNQAQARIASTALALLPFLGAGQTPSEGQYKMQVQRGIDYLVRAKSVEKEVLSLWEPGGRMYGHGLAAIALCEAYGMTHDPSLQNAAQASVNFIVLAQDPNAGGWRYFPGRDGDTSVVGWQLMALKSAHMAYLKVPPETIRRASYFLDSVQVDNGSAYGYTGPGNGPATSSIGLLCRMYMGWKREHPALIRGVEILSERGPSTDRLGPPRNNMYYNYYGTQVMHHFGGYPWQKWNAVMRDYLVKNQSRRGHEYGSWYFEGSDLGSVAGGRLYHTAMATMILEVYYRHMPLYTDMPTKDNFNQ